MLFAIKNFLKEKFPSKERRSAYDLLNKFQKSWGEKPHDFEWCRALAEFSAKHNISKFEGAWVATIG